MVAFRTSNALNLQMGVNCAHWSNRCIPVHIVEACGRGQLNSLLYTYLQLYSSTELGLPWPSVGSIMIGWSSSSPPSLVPLSGTSSRSRSNSSNLDLSRRTSSSFNLKSAMKESMRVWNSLLCRIAYTIPLTHEAMHMTRMMSFQKCPWCTGGPKRMMSIALSWIFCLCCPSLMSNVF